MKKSDVYREWARVLDMCEGTVVNPWNCVRRKTEEYFSTFYATPNFDDIEGDWSFAVAILEDKPVFVGDKVYGKYSNTFYTVSKEMIDRGEHDYSDSNYWSWNPPKKTFMLNGRELPCPDKSNRFELKIFGFGENNYHFNNVFDIRKVEAAINKLLQDATK